MGVDHVPQVSIIMGIYNCADTLACSIESILSQTFTDWELIMCDDASLDNTFETALQYAQKYPGKIQLLRNKCNLTLGPTLNRCLSVAKGKYLARQDGDDISTSSRLETQVNFLENNPRYGLVGTNMLSFDEKGFYGTRVLKSEPEPLDLMYGSMFCHATIMIKAEIMKELNGYSESDFAKQVEDYDLWFRLMARGYHGYNLDEALYQVREGSQAYSRKTFRRRWNEARVILQGVKRLKLPEYYMFFAFKPIILAFIPLRLLKYYHQRLMSNSTCSKLD